MFGSKRIEALEDTVKYLEKRHETLLDKVYAIQGDMGRITEFLGASFENVNTRRLVKKGGPEKGN